MSSDNNSSPFDVITIDLDGTLVDSADELHQAIMVMQDKMRVPTSSDAQVRNWIGNGIERLVHRALTNDMQAYAPDSLFDVAMPVFEAAYAQANGKHAKLYPCVLDGLKWLSQLNTPLIVVTNKAKRFTDPLLEALNIADYFHAIYTADDVVEKKPHPEVLLKAARSCNAIPENCVLIGDSISDIRAAKAAKFTSISVSYGYNHGVPIDNSNSEAQTDAVIDSFLDLPDTFRRLRIAK